MRSILLYVVAAITSLLAIVNASFILLTPDSVTLWDVARVVASVCIVGMGLLTWQHVRTERIGGPRTRVLGVGAVALIGLSVVGTGLALYHGQRSGDVEYYLFPLHWLVCGQGLLTLWHLRQRGAYTSVQ